MSHQIGPTGGLRRRLVSGGAWTFGNRVMVVILGLATNALLTRLMPVAEVGAYFLIANVVVIGAVISQAGMTQAVVRFVADAVARGLMGRARKAIISCLVITSTVVSIMSLGLYMGGGDWLALSVFKSEIMAGSVGLMIVWLFLQTVQRQLGETFRGLHDLRMASIFTGLVSGTITVALLGTMYLVSGSASLADVLWVSVLAIGGSGLLAAMLLTRQFAQIHGDGSVSNAELLSFGAPILLASATNLLLQRADIWIVGMYLSDEDVAIYGAAARLITVVAVPMVMASAVLSPVIAELYAKNDKIRLEKVLRVVATLGGLPAVLIILLFVTFGEPILGIIYGDYYRSSATILVILSLGQLVSMLAGVCAQLLLMTGHQKPVMYISVFSALVAIGVAIILVDTYKEIGVAASFAAGIVLQNVLMAVYAQHVLGVRSYMYFNPLSVLPELRQVRAARRSIK